MSDIDGLPTLQRRWVMACALGGFTLTNLDSAIANIALPTLAHEFSATASATIWVVNIYQLAMAVCLLPAAALGGKFGIKRVYAFGLILFTVASAACALAPSLPMLVLARGVQGIGGACVSGLGPALVRVIYPRKLMGQGLAHVALVIALSGVAGPTIAAGILSVATWPWLFLVNVPVCLIAAPVFMTMAPTTPGDARAFDYPGAALNALALGMMVIGVGQLGGAHRNEALAAIAVGAIVFAALMAQRVITLGEFQMSLADLFTLLAGKIQLIGRCVQAFGHRLHRRCLGQSSLYELVNPFPLIGGQNFLERLEFRLHQRANLGVL